MKTLERSPTGLYTLGLCHHNCHGSPFKTILIEGDSLDRATNEAREKLKPDTTQPGCLVRTDPQRRCCNGCNFQKSFSLEKEEARSEKQTPNLHVSR